MAYLTYAEYSAYNTGVPLTADEFATLYFWAESAIDSYLGYHITEPVHEAVKRAAAQQIALSKMQGGTAYYNSTGNTSQVTSESVPDYSYTTQAKSNTQFTAAKDTFGIFPIVAAMLKDYFIMGVDGIL